MLKIRYKLLEKYQAKQRRKPIRHGYCQICGSKLSDEHSIERGVGRGCLSKNVAIILEIIPDDLPNNASSGLVGTSPAEMPTTIEPGTGVEYLQRQPTSR